MIDEKFNEHIKSNTGCAVILAGSGSDDKPKAEGEKSHIQKIAESLDKYKIPYQVRICSAHKQPEKLMEIINEYNGLSGLVAFVAVAGGTDALSGTLSYHVLGPVISCPPDAPNDSCLRNPPGSSNAYIAKPANVGRFIAQMYAGINPKYHTLLETDKGAKLEALETDDFKINEKYRGE
ncbi:MAG: AIR carboxylase family protein [Nanoarchaeota archaeon]|nr:AIR carboxylase family protein [Nanoarchaeota archaeon]